MLKNSNRYKLRKLTVGLVSVCAGVLFMTQNKQEIHADTNNINTNAKQSIVQIKKTTNEAKPTSNINQNSIKNNSSNSNTTLPAKSQSSSGILQKSNQQVLSNEKLALKQADNATAKTVLNDNLVSKNSLNNSGQNNSSPAAKNGTLTTLNVKQNTFTVNAAKELSESKAVDNTTNGGFDQNTWGKLDVSKWHGSVQGDYYQLDNYSGDCNHIIVPNEADFEKSGISTSGKQVGIAASTIHMLYAKSTSSNATIAFSKTDNKKVKAIDTNWTNALGRSAHDVKGSLAKFDGSNLDTTNITNMGYMFMGDNISDLSGLSNWNVGNVTTMAAMFNSTQVNSVAPLANWNVSKVIDMTNMFASCKLTDLSPLKNWQTGSVISMNNMFAQNQINNLSGLTNWDVGKVSNFASMFINNKITSLDALAKWNTISATTFNNMFAINPLISLNGLKNWNVQNVNDMSSMFSNDGSLTNLNGLENWQIKNTKTMNAMFANNKISNTNALKNWNMSGVTNIDSMFYNDNISDLTPFSTWNTGNMTDIGGAFDRNNVSNVSPLANWNTGKVTDMDSLFKHDHVIDATPLSKWNVKNVTNINQIFDDNSGSEAISVPDAVRTIIVNKPDGSRITITQTVKFDKKQDVTVTTKYKNGSTTVKPDNNIADWLTKTIVKSYTPYVVTGGQNSTGSNFNAYTAPVIAGYTASSSLPVAQAVQGQRLTRIISYTADPRKAVYTFVDDDEKGKHVGSTVVVNGVTNQKNVATGLKMPANYVLNGSSLPTAVSFGTTDQNVTIHLKHATQDVSSSNSGARKAVTRTIHITNLQGQTSTQTQSVTFTRTATKDLITGNISYSAWSENGQHVFGEIDAPAIAGYTPTGNAGRIVVTPNSQNSTVSISYTANQQSVKVSFVDDDNNKVVVGSPITLIGVTDGQADFSKVTVPNNYYEVSKPSYKFTSNGNQTYMIHLKHQTETLNANDDEKNLTDAQKAQLVIDREYKVHVKYPNAKYGNDILSDDKLHFWRSGTWDKVANKFISFSNYHVVENCDGTSYGDKLIDINTTDAIGLSAEPVAINGYKFDTSALAKVLPAGTDFNVYHFGFEVNTAPNYSIDLRIGMNVLGDSTTWADLTNLPASQTFVATYDPQQVTRHVQYVDDDNGGKQVGSLQDVTANVDTVQNITASIPANYTLADGQASSVPVDLGNVKDANGNWAVPSDNVIIHLKHGTATVLDTIKDSQTINTKAGSKTISHSDLNSDGTRTIHITFPVTDSLPVTGDKSITAFVDSVNALTKQNKATIDSTDNHKVTIVQRVDFVRDAQVDLVTGKVTYSQPTGAGNQDTSGADWWVAPHESGDYSAITLPKIAGYTPHLETVTDPETGESYLAMLFVKNSVQPTKPVEPTTPTTPSTKPVSPTKPNKPVEPTKPVQPTTAPSQPRKPNKPNNKPINNGSSVDFNDIVIPEAPAEPVELDNDLHLINEKKLEKIIARRMHYLVSSSKNFSIVYRGHKTDIKHVKRAKR